jgi:uncharacterized protein
MFRRVLYGLMGLVLLAGAVLAAGYFSLKAPPTAGRVLARSDAERDLLAAAREGDTARVAGLLKTGAPPEARDSRGFTPLILAASHGHLDTVRALLEGGADACAGDARGNTALLGAAFQGHVEVVDLLGQQPCAVDQTHGLGQAALLFAALLRIQNPRAPIQARGPPFITGVRQ